MTPAEIAARLRKLAGRWWVSPDTGFLLRVAAHEMKQQEQRIALLQHKLDAAREVRAIKQKEDGK
jgi:hypothetical protein